MGVPYNKLVAPAVLFLNPGVTREEYIELLDNTHSSCFREYNPDEPWDYFDPRMDDNRFHGGLEGLARILGLKESAKYKEFQEGNYDENGLFVRAPYFLPARDGAQNRYEVIIHQRNVVEAPKTVDSCAWDKLTVGDIWEETMMGAESGIVTKIIEEEFIGREDSEEDEWADFTGPQYNYKMEIKPIRGEYKEQKYRTQEDLWEKWPQFHPDFIYEWANERGNFVGSDGVDKFFWERAGDRYGLDQKTFDVIPASGGSRISMGYTDLILTAEAVRHNAWKVLSYRGMKYLDWFLRDFPEAKARYDHAVWDSHTSLFAKMKGMTITELLRFRNQGI
jgi:hypothetical protein